jgi:hypothetical protein
MNVIGLSLMTPEERARIAEEYERNGWISEEEADAVAPGWRDVRVRYAARASGRSHNWIVRTRTEGTRVYFDGFEPCSECGAPAPRSPLEEPTECPGAKIILAVPPQ